MKHIKRWLAVLFALLMLAAFAACKTSKADPDDGSTTEMPQQSTTDLTALEDNSAPVEDDSSTFPAEDDSTTAPAQGNSTASNEETAAPIVVPSPANLGGSNDAAKLVKAVLEIVNSGTYTLAITVKEEGMSAVDMLLVVDQDKQMMEMDLISVLLAGMGGEMTAAQKQVFSTMAKPVFGANVRILMLPGKVYYVFPERKKYVDLSGMMDIGDMGMPTGEMFEGVDPAKISSSKVKLDGKEYICGTMKDEDGYEQRYYFLDGALKRIEMAVEGEAMGAMEVTTFAGTIPSRDIFEIKGMKEMSMDEFSGAFGGF